MNIIDFYQFGKIVVGGKKYTSDIIIFPHQIRDKWCRKTGHELCPEDMAEVLTGNPEVLIVGTGASGLVVVKPEAQQTAEARGTKLIALPTIEACNLYNQLSLSQRVTAALHLTC